MSWLLILLLVLIFVIFAISCIVIIAWVSAGSPNNLNVANTLDVNTPCLLDDPPTPAITATAAAANKRVLLADTASGFVLADAPAKMQEVDEPAERGDNRLVQTLFIDGRPAVSRTTTFAQPVAGRALGPVELREGDAQREIVEWHAQNKTKGDQPEGDVESVGLDVGGLLNRAARLRELRSVEKSLEDVQAAEKAQDDAARKTYADIRRAHLLPALAAAAEKRDAADRLAQRADPRRFHMSLPRDADLCTASSTLIIPVELSVPREYLLDDSSLLEHREVRWSVHEMTKRDPTSAVQLWASPLIPLADIVRSDSRARGSTPILVHTQIDCRLAANKLLRISLADDTPGRRQHEVFCTTHFNPAASISGGPACLGPDLRTAWTTHQQIHNSA